MTRSSKQAGKQADQQRAERTQLLDEAARHLRGNALAKALPLYQQLYDQDPNDWTVANALGDLHLRMNNTDDAVSVFMDLAEHMSEQGHAVKARALYRKVLRMRPGDAAATERVNQLDNVNLDASPFMQRVRGALLDAQATPPPVQAKAPAFEEPPIAVSAPAFASPEPAAPPAAFEPPQATPPAVSISAPPAPVPVSLAAPPAALSFAAPPAPAAPELSPFEAIEWAIPPAIPAPAEPEAPVEAFDEFEPTSDEWMAVGMALAAAPLQDRPSAAVNPARLGAFQRMEASARQSAARGDFSGAGSHVEQFLRSNPHDVEALEMLVEFSTDGQLADTTASQIRLADACVATGRLSTGRHVAVDLLHRDPQDPAVAPLIDRMLVASGIGVHAPHADVRPPDVTPDTAAFDADADASELFDDDGLVTDGGRRRDSASNGTDGDPLGAWLDASDLSDARDAVAAATRLVHAGNIAGAKATLEPLMATPALRPIVGVFLAQVYRREHDYASALNCLEQAAEQPAMHADTAHSLAYELALTLEAMGQRNEALALYRELLREVGPAFRDIAVREEHLSAA